MLYVKETRGDIFKIIGANVRYYRGLYNINNPKKAVKSVSSLSKANLKIGNFKNKIQSKAEYSPVNNISFII